MHRDRPVKIHWLCWQPTPYNNFLFRALAAESTLDLIVHFRQWVIPTHPWHTVIPDGFQRRTYEKVLGFDRELLQLAATAHDAFFIIGGWDEPTCQAVIGLCMVRHQPFAIWSDTPNLQVRRPWWKAILRERCLNQIFRSARAVMGTGRPAVAAFRAMGCPEDRLFEFPYWVPLLETPPFCAPHDCRGTVTKTDLHLLSCGRLDAVKGYDTILRALVIVRSRFSEARVRWTVCGDGPERPVLEREASRQGLLDRIAFLGWQEPSQVRKHMLECDVFLHPARWEPFGVVVLEAMSAGKPVLASDRTMAALDRVNHGKNGFIHPVGDDNMLAEHLGLLATNRDLVRSMGIAARKTAEAWPVERGIKTIKEIVGAN